MKPVLTFLVVVALWVGAILVVASAPEDCETAPYRPGCPSSP